jgi:hypothetical protein
MAQAQRRQVLELVRKHQTPNVVFISGDYHCSATATLDFGSGLKAYALICPPLYAPYVYANAQAHEVMRAETIGLGDGEVRVEAEALDGNGFLDVRVAALGGARWTLDVVTYRLRVEDEQPDFTPVTRQFVLG